ncbi:unnamed protein product [Medioppia subpectinata]|uniref:Amine oxidase domain-containing protein n=1 Tax=Medioppia subpectinata TaxID=1979941 RepID=A0A7R9KMA4_9ACAR|nr:unnamed protein product [Medioppia subpectinata]CAG2105878.1 unnamed protein product [Medioppia subpectinata]
MKLQFLKRWTESADVFIPSLLNGVLELGAQWLHGQHGNPLYYMAKERDLISNPRVDYGMEGTGIFCTDLGQLLNTDDINKVISYLHRIKDEMSDESLNSDELVSAQQIFRINFEKYIQSEECPPIESQLLWSLFNWYIKFEVIDNSCNDLNDISLLSYTQYSECHGIDLINFKDGYQTIIDSMINDIPRDVIRLKTAIKRIEICDKTFRVKLYVEEGKRKRIEIFDHLIITSSIGYMRKNLDTFFGFVLPQNKINIIRTLGFGTIDKIYLYFQNPFWKSEDQGFQLIWTQHNHNLPVWVYDMTGFDLVRGQSHVLVAWIGGNGAQLMEDVQSDDIVGNICAQVLRLFLRDVTIENPSKVIRSKWANNHYICGAYSNRSLNYQRLNCDIDQLSEPIVKTKHSNYHNKCVDCPLILFGGEATDRQFYSTTHGAMRSGQREAQRLIDFYQTVNLKPKL